MKLIEHIVRNDQPFTEIVTADYIMVTPYSARGYGVFDELKAQFKNPDDPFEYIPGEAEGARRPEQGGRIRIRRPASTRTRACLSTFQYLTRYPTTETNRNRLRARMYYQHFLGVDVLELAARVSDAAAVTAKFKVPTMQAASASSATRRSIPLPVCSRTTGGSRTRAFTANARAAGSRTCSPPASRARICPAAERWRSLQWLGERTAKDPRFAVAMIEHVYYILTGRKVLLPPKDLDDPLYPAKLRAYQEQRRQIEAIAARFAKSGFNLKTVFKDWIVSDFYRADGMATAVQDPCRRAELDDAGLVRMLSPEQVERKVGAIFGEPWGKLTDQLAMLYGGIDSKEVTERAADPSGAMGAIQRTLSNDVACKHIARDFASARPIDGCSPASSRTCSRRLPEADAIIRQAIVHLHRVSWAATTPWTPGGRAHVPALRRIVAERLAARASINGKTTSAARSLLTRYPIRNTPCAHSAHR